MGHPPVMVARIRASFLPILFVFCLAFSAQPAQSSASEGWQVASRGIVQFDPWELVTALAWSPDGDCLVVAAGNFLYQVDPVSRQRFRWSEIGALTTDLAFSPQGDQLAAGSRDGFLRIWSLDPQKVNQVGKLNSPDLIWSALAHRKGLNSLDYSPDGLLLVSGGNDGMARIWSSVDGTSLASIIGGAYAVSGVEFMPDGELLAVANGNLVRLREIESTRIQGSFRAESSLASLDVSPQGNLIAASDSNNQVLIWNPAQGFRTGNPTYPDPLMLSAHTGRSGSTQALVWKALFSPDGSWLVSAGGDTTVRLWDPMTGSLLATLNGHRKAVTSLAFNPDGRLLASGSLDAAVRFWKIVPPPDSD